MQVRDPRADEAEALARLWQARWLDAHAAIVPEELVRMRTYENFLERTRKGLGEVRVAGPEGAPLGFSMMKGDELYQLYVATEAVGKGVAQALIADAEARHTAKGATLIWLACAVGNDRAARFYEKSGWRNAGVVSIDLDTPNGPYPFETWRFEKSL